MKINMKSKSVTLATKGCYCPEDVEIEVKMQEKTVTANGEMAADSGFAGLSKVTVAVPEPDAKIIDVTELPTADIDDRVYYRMDGMLYKHRDELRDTLVPNEAITPIASGEGWECYLVPDGELEITQPGTYDVSKYATVVVNITAATQEV